MRSGFPGAVVRSNRVVGSEAKMMMIIVIIAAGSRNQEILQSPTVHLLWLPIMSISSTENPMQTEASHDQQLERSLSWDHSIMLLLNGEPKLTDS